MKINPRKILLHTQATVDGRIAFDGETYVFDGIKRGEEYIKSKIEQMREELGIENPTPEELFRYMVVRTWTNTNGALYASGDGPEISNREFFRESIDLKRQMIAYAKARKNGQQAEPAPVTSPGETP